MIPGSIETWKILLQGVAVTCLQFRDFVKHDPKDKNVNSFPAARFGPNFGWRPRAWGPGLGPCEVCVFVYICIFLRTRFVYQVSSD